MAFRPRHAAQAGRDAWHAWRLMAKEPTGSLRAHDAVQLVIAARRYQLDAYDLWRVWEYWTNRNLHDAVTKALEVKELYRRKPGPATLN